MEIQTEQDLERPIIFGIYSDKDDARITLRKVPDQPGIAAKIFSPIAEANILVDMIIQNTRAGGQTDLTFTIPKTDFKKAMEIEKKVAEEIGAEAVMGDEAIAKVSVVGVGMKSHTHVASKMFSALAKENINLMMISTSEIRISCVIEEQYSESAVRTLHEAFGLKQES